MSNSKSVFETLNSINVNDKVEKKNNLMKKNIMMTLMRCVPWLITLVVSQLVRRD